MSEVMMVPPNWPMMHGGDEGMYGTILMSNIDHQVNEAVAQRLKDEQAIAEYCAWNFHADVWFTEGQYHAAVARFHRHVGSYSADTPQELMRIISAEHGDE